MELFQEYLQQYGYLCVFILVLIEYANAPLPSEVVLPLVGFLIADGHMKFIPALIVSIVAGTLGSLINYMIGTYFREWTIRVIISKSEKLEKSLHESMKWINKYGNLSVMVGRVIPLIRTVIAIPAGLVKMPIGKYILFSSIGIGVWNGILISMGVVFAGNIEKIATLLKNYSVIMLVLIIVLIVVIMLRNKSKKRKNIIKD